jgi:hypothetical protein
MLVLDQTLEHNDMANESGNNCYQKQDCGMSSGIAIRLLPAVRGDVAVGAGGATA